MLRKLNFQKNIFENFSKCQNQTYFAIQFLFFLKSVYFVMKCWKNEFQNLHTFDPGGGGGPLSFTRKIPAEEDMSTINNKYTIYI